MTGSKMIPIAFDFLTVIKGAIIPMGVAIININKLYSPVNYLLSNKNFIF